MVESPPVPVALTVGTMARRAGVDLHQIEYVIRSRKMPPLMRAGNSYIYSEEQFAFIQGELQRIASDRGEGGRETEAASA